MLIVGSLCIRETDNIPLSMVIDRGHILREHRDRVIIYRYRGVRPPQEGLGHFRAVIQLCRQFDIRLIGIKGHPQHPFRTEHVLDLSHPDCRTSILIFRIGIFHRIKGAGSVMLGPVKFNATRDPGAGQSHQRRFDDMIVVDKIIAVGLVISPLDPSTQFRQHHHLQIIIFQKKRRVFLIHFLIADFLDHCVRINSSRASLIDTFLQKYRVLIRFPGFVSGDRHFFFPYMYFIHAYLHLYASSPSMLLSHHCT